MVHLKCTHDGATTHQLEHFLHIHEIDEKYYDLENFYFQKDSFADTL